MTIELDLDGMCVYDCYFGGQKPDETDKNDLSHLITRTAAQSNASNALTNMFQSREIHVISAHEEAAHGSNTIFNNREDQVLCKNNEKDCGRFEYEFSFQRDTEGNTNAHGEIDYSRQSDDSKFSVGIGADVEQDSRGETKASVEANVKGYF